MKEKTSEDAISFCPKEVSAARKERALPSAWGSFWVVFSVSSGNDLDSFSLHPSVLNHKMLIMHLKEILNENVWEVH